MERLTEYDEFGNAEFIGIDNTKLYERLVCDETVALTIATNKLAKLEDVLEKYGIEIIQELDARLQSENQYATDLVNLQSDIEELKQQLAEKDKEIEELKYYTENTANLIDKLTEDSISASKQLAIEQLEKVKKQLRQNITITIPINEMQKFKDYLISVDDFIDNQIKNMEEDK